MARRWAAGPWAVLGPRKNLPVPSGTAQHVERAYDADPDMARSMNGPCPGRTSPAQVLALLLMRPIGTLIYIHLQQQAGGRCGVAMESEPLHCRTRAPPPWPRAALAHGAAESVGASTTPAIVSVTASFGSPFACLARSLAAILDHSLI
jgi:hypothetical protein